MKTPQTRLRLGNVPKGQPGIAQRFIAGFDPNTLLRASDGNFYGTTAWGGPRYATGGAGYGTFFKLTPDGNFTFLYWFHNTNGVWPTALVEGSDGNFYGTTAYGGSRFLGTVLRITPDGTHTMLASFSGTNGLEPVSLMRATDGNFYGTTRTGDGNARNGTFKRAKPLRQIPFTEAKQPATRIPPSTCTVTDVTYLFSRVLPSSGAATCERPGASAFSNSRVRADVAAAGTAALRAVARSSEMPECATP